MRRLLPVSAFLCSCAAVTSDTQRFERRVDRSYSEVVQTKSDVTLTNPGWQGQVATAELSQNLICTTFDRQDVTHTTFRDVETENGFISVAGSVLLVLAGGAAVAAAPEMSTAPNYNEQGEETASDQDVTYVLGGLAIATGVGGAIVNGYTWSKGGTTQLSQKQDKGLLVQQHPGQTCDTLKYTGPVQIDVFNQSLERTAQNGLLELPLKPSFCTSKDPAKVYVDGKLVGQIPVAQCFYAATLLKVLNALSDQLQNPTVSSIRTATKGIEEVATVLPHLAEPAWRTPVEDRLAEVRFASSDAAQTVVDTLLVHLEKQLQDPDETPLHTAVDAATISLSLTTNPDKNFQKLLQILVSAERLSPRDFETLISALPAPYATCLKTGECDQGLSKPAADGILAPVYTAFAKRLKTNANAVLKAAEALNTKPSSNTQFELTLKEDDFSETFASACDLAITNDELTTACDTVRNTREAATNARTNAQASLQKQAVGDTFKQWRAIFPQCRKVREGIAAFEGISNCSGECRDALNRIRHDHAELQKFFPVNPTYTPESVAAIRAECRDAGCPNCP